MIIYLSHYNKLSDLSFSHTTQLVNVMAEISNDIRLAVDSGKAAFGINSTSASINTNKARMIIVASKNREGRISDVLHLAKISNIRVHVFEGTPVALGVVCGKPFSVSVLSILEPGNSKILETEY